MEPRNQRSKEEIAQALISLMREKDFALITNKEITDRALLSHITYYRNFSCKEDVLRFYLHKITDDFIARTGILYDAERFRDYLICLFDHLLDQRALGELLLKAGMLYLIKDEFDRIFSGKARDGKELYHYYFLAGGLYNLYYLWLKDGCALTPAALAELFSDFKIGG